MPYCRLFYHFVWTTKYREPWITSRIEPYLFQCIRKKTKDLHAKVFALNSHLDHIHLLVSIPPRVSPAAFIGQVKGASTFFLNQSGLLPSPVYWQEEYGVFTVDRRTISGCIVYINRQKEHHLRENIHQGP